MKRRRFTPRGFAIYGEVENADQIVTVIESSAADGAFVWIFASKKLGGRDAPHLSVEDAAQVRDALTEFIDENQGAVE